MNYKKIKIIEPKLNDGSEVIVNKDKLLTRKELDENIAVKVRTSGNLQNTSYYVASSYELKYCDFHLVIDDEGVLVLLPVKK